jgi:iron(III) transport system ATP-binding protein
MAGTAVPPAIELRCVAVAYDGAPVLSDLDLRVEPGETLALLGPSGSGKTTLLFAVAGFLGIAGGEIRIAGRLASDRSTTLAPERRDVAVVFQQYALWPHLNAVETVAYPIRRRGVDRARARLEALDLLERMGVAHLAERRPAQLSGGEQQRVGVARALARRAAVILLDEPTAHLDTPLRSALGAELSEQRRRSGAAAVYATHDVSEALAVADRVALLRDGRIVQVGDPRAIYERPADLWAARLSGPASVVTAELVGDGRVRIAGREVSLALDRGARSLPNGGTAALLVRPDWVSLGGELPGAVSAVWFRGPWTDYRLETAAGTVEVREPGPPRAAPGQAVGWTLTRAWLIDAGAQAGSPP